MTTTTRLIVSLFATTLIAGTAMAKPEFDTSGRCRDNGKFVEKSLCQAAAPAGGKCRDIKSKKFAKCGTPNTEPVPTGNTATK